MLVHVNSKNIHVENETINIQDAFGLLDSQSTFEQMDDNFIGFTHPKFNQIIIQFVRQTQNEWVIDIPTYNNGIYNNSLSAPINHNLVFTIVRDFFDPNSKIQSLLSEYEYKELQKLFMKSYKISLEFF